MLLLSCFPLLTNDGHNRAAENFGFFQMRITGQNESRHAQISIFHQSFCDLFCCTHNEDGTARTYNGQTCPQVWTYDELLLLGQFPQLILPAWLVASVSAKAALAFSMASGGTLLIISQAAAHASSSVSRMSTCARMP